MRAIVVEGSGSDSRMILREVPDLSLPGIGEVRIRVVATAVNRADLLQRRGFYPPPPGASPILGLECAGIVDAVGPGVPASFTTGMRVMALLAGGGYAEQVVVHHGSVMPVPQTLTDEEAGGFPEVFLTVFSNVFQLGALPPAGTILVHGGGSGIGTATIAMAREVGATCYVTAGTPEKCARCVDLGATAAIDYRQEDFADRIAALTDGRGVDVVLDSIGGPYLERNLRSLCVGGRLVMIGLTGGASAEIPLGLLLLRRLHLIGSTLRSRSLDEKAALVASFREGFGAAVESGRLRPVVDSVIPLAEVERAHARVAASEHVGKVILRVA